MASSGRDEAGRLVGGRAADGDPAGGDVGLGLLAAGGQAPPHQLGVEAAARQRSGLLDGFLAGATCLARRAGLLGGRLLRRSAAVFLAGAFFLAAFLAVAFLAGAFFAGAARGPSSPERSAVPTSEAMRRSMRSRSAWLASPRLVICCAHLRARQSRAAARCSSGCARAGRPRRRAPGRPAPRRPSPGPSPAPRPGPG